MLRAPLPIDAVVPLLREVLHAGARAVLQAPPGAGKTTVVPLALLGEPWAAHGKIIVLEPRRLAARAAARRMALLHGDAVGETVGFRVRGETRVGPRTRIEVVTEGVLTRMLVIDPTLDGVAAVIFDEFHERSAVADTGLALALHTAELVRPDLRLLVMSATLDGAGVAALLGGAEIVTAKGRAFPVDTRWAPPHAGVRPVDAVPRVVRRAIDETDGDVLVFLPGAGEIRRVANALDGVWARDAVRIVSLHGSMTGDEQDAAIAPALPGRRKIVLATSVAETSLTIEGVRAVVDSGLARVPRFDPQSGMSRLETVRVTQDAAVQRAGRAGRTAPGVCYRLWSQAEHAALLARRTPEILSADLAPLALELALTGITDVAALRWLDIPPPAALAQARDLLVALDAMTADGRATAHGSRIAEIGLHPRLAHLVVRGAERGGVALASLIAALLGDRDIIVRGDADADPDIGTRVALLRGDGRIAGVRVDESRLHRLRDEARRITDRVGGSAQAGSARRADGDDASAAAELVALAYPDRVARAAGKRGRFRMRNGRGALVPEASPLAGAAWLAIADTDGKRDDARVYLAAELDAGAVERLFSGQIVETRSVGFDDTSGAVLATVRRTLGALVLAEHSQRVTDSAVSAAAFAARVREVGTAALPWSESGRRMRERLAFVHTLDPAWPDVSDSALDADADQWLAPALAELRRWSDLGRTDLAGALLSRVPGRLRAQLDRFAPAHIEMATGSRIPVDYSNPAAPAFSVRMQELYGTAETPRVSDGRVPLTLHLLSPAGRPLQVTRDLPGFWAGSYAEVRKEMRGRYPRHEWPEDPRAAPATKRAKPRRPA
ncbi:MAG: ATP-dependent helicase HrpB [Gemmatimonadota bacterium]|nr:ATP-dependent helicase HrpB [Gemmatimonadota bacterium]